MSVRNQPAYDAVAISLASTDDALATRGPCDAIYIGGSGDLVIKTLAGRTVTFVGVEGGSVLPVGASTVVKTGTTATNLLALYTGA